MCKDSENEALELLVNEWPFILVSYRKTGRFTFIVYRLLCLLKRFNRGIYTDAVVLTIFQEILKPDDCGSLQTHG